MCSCQKVLQLKTLRTQCRLSEEKLASGALPSLSAKPPWQPLQAKRAALTLTLTLPLTLTLTLTLKAVAAANIAVFGPHGVQARARDPIHDRTFTYTVQLPTLGLDHDSDHGGGEAYECLHEQEVRQCS